MPMSTTPVRTALPTSKGGIAFGPPMKVIVIEPLASAFTALMNCSSLRTYSVFSANALTARSCVPCAWAAAAQVTSDAAASNARMIFLMVSSYGNGEGRRPLSHLSNQ